MDLEWHVVARLLAAALLGAAVGAERESSDQPAGLRTHLTVAIGAALFGVVSTVGFDEFQTARTTNVRVDVTRVASTVVTGIGFLGAGLIFRRGMTVHNLTTAGSLFVVSAVGLSCGVGDIGPAFVTTLVLLVALVALRAPRAWIRRHVARDSEPIRVVLRQGVDEAGLLAALRSLPGVRASQVLLERQRGAYVVSALLEARPEVDLRESVATITRRDDVETLLLGGDQLAGDDA